MRFKLIKQPNGVYLRAYPDGEGELFYNLVVFGNNGNIQRKAGVPNNIGFQVDDIGRILVNERDG